MPRPLRLLLVLLAVSGCQGLRGCGSSEPTPAAALVLDASTPLAPPPPEARYARSWLVILHASSTRGEGAGALEALAKTGLPGEPDRLSTNAFRGLRPCLEVVVARAFAGRAEAEAFQQRLAEAGVAAYVKYAGALDSERERKEATCRAEAESAAARAQARAPREAPRFVEVHDGRTFLLLGPADKGVALAPVDERRSLWMAPAETDPTGLFAKGDSVDLYGVAGPVQSGCKVTGFAWLNRGVPHVGYFQQQPPPQAPGCGQPWAFAELDCGMTPNDVTFALPSGTKAPVFFARGEGPSDEVLAAQERALRESPLFARLRAEGAIQAERTQERLQQNVTSSAFSQGERHVVLSVARVRTGEGNSMCGSDYSGQLTRAVVLGPEGAERVLGASELDGDEVAGVLDLEGDGKVELLLHDSWPTQRVRLVREDGSEVAGAEVENCDCGC